MQGHYTEVSVQVMVRSVRSPLGNGGGGGETSLFTQLASMSDMRTLLKQLVEDGSDKWGVALVVGAGTGAKLPLLRPLGGSEARRVGKECVGRCRTWGSPWY